MSPNPRRLRMAAAGAALLALTAAAPAAAAPAAIYGGRTSQNAPIALRASADGRKLTQLLVHVDLKCDDGSELSWSGAASFASFKPPTIRPGRNVFSPARVSRSGGIRATGEAPNYYGDDAFGTVSEQLHGSIHRAVAHGTYAASITLTSVTTGARLASCHSGTLRWAARSAPGRIYAGRTSDGSPVVVQRSRTGGKVDSLWMSWDAPCQSGGAFILAEEFVGFRVSRTGRFGNPFADEVRLQDGGTRRYAYELAGSVGTSRASGSFRVQVTEMDMAGATRDTCDTTALRWTARSTPGRTPRRRPAEIRRVGP